MNPCIISVGVGHWYPKGIHRLGKSLNYHGWPGDTILHTEYPEGCPPHNEVPYALKVYAFQEAFDKGYTSAMWLDSSVWCIKYPDEHINSLAGDGYYLVDCEFMCDEWTNDNCLNHFGLTREQAREIPMISGGILGLNMDFEIAREFFAQYKGAMEAGAFKGMWKDDEKVEGSGDRYKGHRHDQSCASIIAHRLGMKIHPFDTYDVYYRTDMPETTEFTLRGM